MDQVLRSQRQMRRLRRLRRLRPVSRSRSRSRSLASRNASKAGAVQDAVLAGEDTGADVLQASVAALKHIPTAVELAANPADLVLIRGVFGSRAQTLINTLLSFDAFFNWYYPMVDSIPLFADEPVKEQRAFDNMCSAIDMHGMFERLSIHNHKSFLIHGAVYKVTRDILNVGDVWAFCLSALELQNAETKRVASSSACKRLTLSTSGETRRPLGPGVSGPPQLVPTKGYGSTMVLSTMNHLLAAQKLRLCADLGENIAMPASRRASRLMHTGRLNLGSAGLKLEMLRGAGYEPRHDTCIKAFVRLLIARAK